MNIQIRSANQNELEWINQRYAEIQFKPSSHLDRIIILEVDSRPAGIGRLVRVSPNASEMGGIYVFPDYQGKGLAEKIVSALLADSGDFQIVYCIPFVNLKPFYMRFGFTEANNFQNLPDEITKKLQFCEATYEEKVCLLEIKKAP